MEMREGLIASGLGHGLLFGWALVAGFFDQRAPEPDFRVTEVSVISTAEFEALSSDAPSLSAPETPRLRPPTPEAPAPTAPVTPDPPRPSPAPEATEAPRPETQPTPLPPTPRAAVSPEAPAAPEQPAADPTLPVVAERPAPRPAPRVAPTPAPRPAPDAEIAPLVQEAPEPSETAPAEPQEVLRPTAPEEAAPRIVTEADIPSGAPERSIRPAQRPAARPTAPETTPAPETNTSLADAIAGAIEEAADPQTPAAAGPPLTRAETDGFRLSVQSCWNVGSLSSQALRTTVTIAFDMNRDGTPVASSVRMARFDGGDEASARQAYEAGRRAIIRCGASGFDLPVEKYEQWKQIEMTFNPEQMRIR